MQNAATAENSAQRLLEKLVQLLLEVHGAKEGPDGLEPLKL